MEGLCKNCRNMYNVDYTFENNSNNFNSEGCIKIGCIANSNIVSKCNQFDDNRLASGTPVQHLPIVEEREEKISFNKQDVIELIRNK